MRKMTRKQLINYIDSLNIDSFNYFGVMHERSGYRPYIELQKKFIDDLKATPYEEIEILTKSNIPDNIAKYSIVLKIGGFYVNIYPVKVLENTSDERTKNLNKQVCLIILQNPEEK